MPLLTLTDVRVAFGHLPLLDAATLQVDAGERVAVLGRNGAGKSTLLQVLDGSLPPDTGVVWRQPGLRVSRLVQDVPLVSPQPVFDVVAEGLGDLSALVTDYHHAAREVAAGGGDDALARLGTLQHALEERDGWTLERRVEQVVDRLALPADAVVDTLSGGWRRRVLLARALVGQPDLLLLDEPTNHLDIEAIDWLETFLLGYPGAVLFVTHDRAFLERVATRIVDLDRGRLTSWPVDYVTYLRRKDEALAAEEAAAARHDRALAVEEAWLRQGIKARRTRNEGRVRALISMREAQAARRARIGQVRMAVQEADPSGQIVFEAEGLHKAFGDRTVIRDCSTRILRGDRVGLLGANGTGKTTLLRMLLGELAPDGGEVRRGAGVAVAYYDQQREQLDPDRTVADTVSDGNDTVTIDGRPRHVIGYLQDFLFPPERSRSPVRALSGGERNRLLLARLFTRPANVLVLDEPTNDLDLETLELLEAQLVSWSGTLLLVSHDRRFLDNVVTSTLAFEGDGRVQEYVGGYADWVRQRPQVPERSASAAGPERSGAAARQAPARPEAPARTPTPQRLSFKEQRELESLPARIEALEAEQRALEAEVSAPEFYRSPAAQMSERLARLEALPAELLQAYARWESLESRTR